MNPLLLGILALGGFMVFAQMQPKGTPYEGQEPDPTDPLRMYDASYSGANFIVADTSGTIPYVGLG